MSEGQVVETVYGKYSKFEVLKKGGSFYIYKDGKYHRGSFSSLKAAVEAAQSEG